MMNTQSLSDPMSFEKGNDLYRQEAYEQAAAHYVNALSRYKGFKPIYVNLALALRKIDNKKVCDQLLRNALEVVRPGQVDNDIELVKKSRLVNGKWYLVEHEVWMPHKVDPVLHYLAVGWRLGLNPCKRFDNDFYLETHKAQMQPNEVPLLHYLYKGQAKGNEIKDKEANGTANLAVQLWNGHSVSALKALEDVYNDPNATEASRWWAMWHTARWLYFCGEIEAALAFAGKMRELTNANKSRKETVYLTYFCLLTLGRSAEAYDALKPFVERHPNDADAHFALTNALSDDAKRIELINQAFAIHGFSGIRRKDKTQPLSIGNVVGLPAPKVKGTKKVSIIMPIYSAGEQVRIAIESLLAQTYENIEIIAVDDCSPDDTFEVLKALEKEDPRVKAVQPPHNGGAYAARNYGLTFATGDLFTTHDSDDWSHPQKIATQVAYLEKHPSVKGCSAHWIRAQGNLAFTQNWRPNSCLTHWSQSSFMFRKEVLDTIGEWDHVRIGGDTEYIWRMQAQFGKKSFAKIYPDTPLAFALDEESSLTRTKATHVRTVYYGLRHIYREICAWWHASQKHLNVRDAKAQRAFPAPRSMFERTDEPLVFNTVIAGDFSRLEDCRKAAEFIGKHSKQKVALFHWPSFHKAPEALCNLYFELLKQGKVEPVVMGQVVNASHYKTADNTLTEYPLDGYPEFIGLKNWGAL
ncbi:glycosyltransferase family 2 protein [Halomonas sp. NyZ770]|uniref:glycosyltransferase family 2 protein n=1 Tax=Halomonas sp. NyZ770 TaxID=2883106 RepID=UPI001D0B1900|nr:glycosyltransferase family A protein [Halomonas sp. NyZ770]UDM08499.1 glycosyltransferase family 2 protein [Halomonas sp. NyZ770]